MTNILEKYSCRKKQLRDYVKTRIPEYFQTEYELVQQLELHALLHGAQVHTWHWPNGE